jgi:LmbE family N-acetylglucosaminyl deacetylase
MQLILVSPHFDDAIGSCAGLTQRARAAGHGVEIVTVMSAPAFGPMLKHLVLRPQDWRLGEPLWYRAREDKRACDVLNCARSELGFTDALYRRTDGAAHYPAPKDLNGALHANDADLPTAIANALAQRASGAVFGFPLAIGDHVDHPAPAAAGALLVQLGASVFYFRDFFYQGAPKAMAHEMARAQPGAVNLTTAELDRKIKALACYTTQMANLYAGADMDREIRAREAVEHLYVPANDARDTAKTLAACGVTFG